LDKQIKIVCDNCLNILPKLKSNVFDLVITDPPYGIEYNTGYREHSTIFGQNGVTGDNADNLPFLNEVLKQLDRVTKADAHIYWFSHWSKAGIHDELLEENGFKVKNHLIWIKNNWSMGDLHSAYANQYEVIIFGVKGNKQLNELGGLERHTDILQFDRVSGEELKHSCQKPLMLMKFLMEKSSNTGDWVLDPFLGTGTTSVAAKVLERNCLGIEIEQKLCELANERISKVDLLKVEKITFHGSSKKDILEKLS
jgi:DNA modification methylase